MSSSVSARKRFVKHHVYLYWILSWSLSNLDVSISHVLVDPVNKELAPFLRHYDGVCSLQEFILLKFLFPTFTRQYSGWVSGTSISNTCRPIIKCLKLASDKKGIGKITASIFKSQGAPTMRRWNGLTIKFQRKRERRVVAQNNIAKSVRLCSHSTRETPLHLRDDVLQLVRPEHHDPAGILFKISYSYCFTMCFFNCPPPEIL